MALMRNTRGMPMEKAETILLTTIRMMATMMGMYTRKPNFLRLAVFSLFFTAS